MQMFMAALVTIIKNWKPKCSELTKYNIFIQRNTISISSKENKNKTKKNKLLVYTT